MDTRARDRSLSPDDAAVEMAGGGMVIVSGPGAHDPAGHLVVAAEFADQEAINFMTKAAGGLICLALPEERCRDLGIQSLPSSPAIRRLSEFTVSIEAARGVTTGISAADRARTVAVAADPATSRDDLVSPGHVFPLCARTGGPGERPGAAETAIELVGRAGLSRAAVLCQVLNGDGSSASSDDLLEHSRELDIGVIRVEDLLEQTNPAPAGSGEVPE